MEPYNPPQDPLAVLYQDEHIIVVNKPSGLLSVPGRLPEHKDSVMTRLQRDFPLAESVHRLDMATSGIILVALTKAAERELKRQFREREPKKNLSGARLGSSRAGRRAYRSAADLRLAAAAKTESLL